MLSLNILDFARDVTLIDDQQKLAIRAVRESKKLGLDFVAMYGGYLETGGALLHPGLPKDWTDYYMDRGYLDHDPAFKKSINSILPFKWSDVTATPDLSLNERSVMLEAKDANLNNGVVVPIHGPNNYTGFVSFGGEVEKLDDDTLPELQVMAVYLHHRLREIVGDLIPYTEQCSILTPREQECLKWISHGKSDWEIGEILSVSQYTVRAHAEHIKQKFGVRTRVQAVVEAIRLKEIAP